MNGDNSVSRRPCRMTSAPHQAFPVHASTQRRDRFSPKLYNVWDANIDTFHALHLEEKESDNFTTPFPRLPFLSFLSFALVSSSSFSSLVVGCDIVVSYFFLSPIPIFHVIRYAPYHCGNVQSYVLKIKSQFGFCCCIGHLYKMWDVFCQ